MQMIIINKRKTGDANIKSSSHTIKYMFNYYIKKDAFNNKNYLFDDFLKTNTSPKKKTWALL